ncbi:hypothetical protein LCGC14_3023600, partial [marine sediment metagenome]
MPFLWVPIHEAGHVIATVLTGGWVEKIEWRSVQFSGRAPTLVLLAGEAFE